jgi:riboflavin transporter FmnP
MLLDFPLPMFVNFLKIDLSDVPALIGGLSLGPMAAVLIELIKNLLHLVVKNDTGGVGEVANFLVGTAYILPVTLLCRRRKNVARFILGAALGTFTMAAVASVMNYYVLIPLYAIIYGAPVSAFVEMAQKLNAAIHDLFTLILFSIAPFNVVKAILISLVGYWLYKLLRKFL